MSKSYTAEQKKFLLELVRNTIKDKLEGVSEFSTTTDAPEWLKIKQSCFVTLHTKDGQLRGCIGNMVAFEPLYDNIIHNAINSAFKDPRFMPLSSMKEFDGLKIEISILTPMIKVNSYKEIIPGKHGIHLTYNGYSSVFLPQVAPEQGWTLEETLTHLSMKAGLNPDTWKLPEAKFEIFEAITVREN
jgi:AmmeMemoRadiSam system protein A